MNVEVIGKNLEKKLVVDLNKVYSMGKVLSDL